MSTAYISANLRRQVIQDAGDRCGFCRCSESITSTALFLDHIIPQSAGGSTTRENLWRVCGPCNLHKADRQQARDPKTDDLVVLFNPRTQSWSEHFIWGDDGCHIVGRTPTGRATVDALRLNRDLAITARRAWVSVGWHPPSEGE